MKKRILTAVVETIPTCKCSTGRYCSIHGRYGTSVIISNRDESDIIELEGMQRCGGGRRILRKRLGE